MSDLVLLGGVKKTACRIWGEEKQRKRWSLHMSNLCKGEVLWLWRKHFPFTGRIQTHWMQNGKTTDSKEKGLRHVGSMLHWAPAFCLELLTFPSSTLMALINASNKNLGGKNWFDLLIHLKCIQVSNDIYIYISSKSVHKKHKSLQLRSPACKPDLSSTELMMEVLMGFLPTPAIYDLGQCILKMVGYFVPGSI